MRIGYFNVRTVYQTIKTTQFCWKMKMYDLDILGISESRWLDKGRSYLSNDNTGVIFSGRNDEHYSEGVAIMITSKVERLLLNWEPINERIINAQFNTRYFKLTIVQCVAPTNDGTDANKGCFYDSLLDIINKTPRHDIVVVMGDFSAKLWDNNIGVEKYLGSHSLRSMNQNIEKVFELCELSNLVVETCFPLTQIYTK